MVNYLSSFEYHIAVEWYIFVLVGFTALVLTILTVSMQSIRTALVDPVKSLRSE